jgi:hypothetical protein
VNVGSAVARWGTRPYDLVEDALRGITWSQIRGAAWFGLGVWAFTFVIEAHNSQLFQTIPWHVRTLRSLTVFELEAFCLLVALVIADRAVDEGANRRLAYTAAALGGCLAGILVNFTVFNWAWRAFVWPGAWPPPTRPWMHALYYAPIYELASWLLIGGSAVSLYADRRAARKTEAHLQAAELDRIRRSKLALESRLQAMQARVEPQFLFNTLAQVERLYARNPVLGGRMLDDLIDYLRAAMPHMRDTSSTVAQEIDLVRAYLDIVRIRSGEQLTFSIEVAPGVEDIRMPPMMLLPLLDRSIEHVLAPPRATGIIAIRVAIDGGLLRLTVADRRADLAPDARDDALASLRERLTALYGTKASLELRHTDAGDSAAILEIPLEPHPPDVSSGRGAIRQLART